MPSRLFRIIVLTLCVAATASVSAHERFRFIGTVVKMDAKEKLLTIKIKQTRVDYPPQVEVAIVDTTKIERADRTLTASALKPGLYVVVDALGDDVVSADAVTIKIVPAPAKSTGK